MENLEDIYETSSRQEGILFESVASPAPGLYVEQLWFSLHGTLDGAAMRAAWQRLVARHAVLRTCFPWQAADRPVQVVLREVELPWVEADWRTVPRGELEVRFAALLAEDVARGLELETGPLMRLGLVRVGDAEHRLVWTFHHILLDGWCLPILVRELDVMYQAARRGATPELPPTRPYRDYVRWQLDQSLVAAEAFWREELAGLPAPTLLGATRRGGTNESARRVVQAQLSSATTEGLRALARRHHLTPSTLCQGVWALLLGRYTGQSEVVLGVAVSGRPPALAGIEDMIGLFVGVVPARFGLDHDGPLVGWLAAQQPRHHAREQHDAPLVKLQHWSSLPSGTPLFDALFAFENYPGGDEPLALDDGRLRMELGGMVERTNYPLEVLVAPGARLGVRAAYDAGRLDGRAVEALVQGFVRRLDRLVAQPEISLRALAIDDADELALVTAATARAHGETRAPAPPLPAAAGPRPPRTPAEQQLSAIWAEVLGREAVGIDDDFLSIGGDSIVAIQIVSRARRAGFALTPRDLFEHATVARLAAVAGREREAPAAAAAATGEIPLTPIQRWFFAQPGPPHHFNQAIALVVPAGLEPARLRSALLHVLDHHEALRLRFHRDADGRWRQSIGPRLCDPEAVPLTQVSLVGRSESEQRSAIEAAARQWQGSLDPSTGALMRIGCFELGSRAVLVWIMHHLVVDAVSWRVLVEDLEASHAALAFGRPVELPAPTTTLAQWANALVERAGSDALTRELEHWHAQLADLADVDPVLVPLDGPEPTGGNRVADEQRLTVTLAAATTRALLQQAPAAYHTQVNDLLLTALAQTLASATGRSRLRIDLESHGREELDGLDPSRTVGWFTSLFPLQLRANGGSPGADIRAVKDVLRRVPGRGLGFGLLAQLRGDATLASAPAAQLCFDYLGQLDASFSDGLVQGLAELELGPIHGPERERPYAISVDGFVSGGQLHLQWSFGGKLHRRETIEALARAYAERLAALVDHCLTPGVGGYSPADFPAASLDEADLERLLARLPGPTEPGGVEDVYDLAPLQQGLLFEALYAPRSGTNIEQFHFTLEGRLDAAALELAWTRILERHEVLRTSIHWERLRAPVQVVHRRVVLPWTALDWRGRFASAAEREAALAERLAADRAEELELHRAPLCRFLLVRTDDDRHELVWTFHHIVLDGWCLPLVFTELLGLYDEAREGRAPRLPLPPRYRGFIAWCRDRDRAEAARFWREYLAGCREATRVELPRPATVDGPSHAMLLRSLPAERSTALRELAQRCQVTPYIVLQGLWALLLRRYGGSHDVLFGAAVSGRPPELPGVEHMVGLFVNTIPVRVRLPDEAELEPWLRQLQREQRERERHAFLPLPEIQGHCEVPRGRPMFESLIVYENYPVDEALRGREHIGAARVLSIRGLEQISCPLTAIFEPGLELGVRLMYDATRHSATSIERIADELVALVDELVAAPATARLGEISATRREAGGAEATAAATVAATATMPAATLEPVHVAFARHAARTPRALAVACGEQRLDYGELDHAAQRVAVRLRRLGVGPETTVALCVDRSLAWIVGMLGVLKAGGAFVPIAPGSPDERIGMLLHVASPRVVLTERRHVGRLPAGCPLLCLDELRHDADDEALATAEPPARLDALAYVIFTSGSTGTPKGVAVEHRGLANLVAWHQRRFGVRPSDRASQLASIAFDASVWEVWPYLAAGASVHLLPDELLLEPAGLRDWLGTQAISLSFVPTALVAELLALPWPASAPLRAMLTGGDKLHHGPPPGLPFALVNAYGPTEASVVSTAGEIPSGGVGTPTLGRAIAGTTAHVVDARLRAVEPGLPGELLVGGQSLARGYLGQPSLTAARFVPNPFGPGRLYRTGDLVRERADGELEFLGRIDDQISLRGHRIEPGEIEAVLDRHPAVRGSLVTVHEQGEARRSLVAYVLHASAAEDEAAAEHQARWQQLFETTYARGSDPEPPAAPAPERDGFDTVGWASSYTGDPIAAEEMAAWVEAAVGEILRLRPRRVLEIGCGTGLLVARIAPHCEVYRATDYSREAIARVERLRDRTPALAHVELSQQPAHELSGCPPQGFDLVVINSVVQYFANVDYLVEVLAGAAGVVAPGGHVLVGDVRSHALLEGFHASVALARATPGLGRDALRQRIARRMAAERELLVDPALFLALAGRVPGIAGAAVELQRGPYHNEMTRFRYQALLQIGPAPAGAPSVQWRRWGVDVTDVDELPRLVAAAETGAVLGVRGIPNRRLALEAAALRWLSGGSDVAGDTVAELRRAFAAAPDDAIEPEQLWALDVGPHHRVRLSWSSEDPCALDLWLVPHGLELSMGPHDPARATAPWTSFGSQVQVSQGHAALVHELEAHVRGLLPAYMCPSAIIPVARWPLTPNGKIDRRALPPPSFGRAAAPSGARLHTPTERTIAAIWTEVLGVEVVDAQTDFFDAGGHSLSATQVVSRLLELVNVRVPVRTVFEKSTVSALAEHVDALVWLRDEDEAGTETERGTVVTL